MFRTSFPNYRQLDQMDCGPTCLKIIGKYYEADFDIQDLRGFCQVGRQGTAMGGLILGATAMKMDAMAIHCDFDELSEKIPLPCIAHWRSNHYVVVVAFNGNTVMVSDPANGILEYSKEEFLDGWLDGNKLKEGIVLLIRPKKDFVAFETIDHGGNTVFNFLSGYFLPYKKLLYQLALGIILGSVLQIAIPFLTQSIVDYGINFNDLNFIMVILLAQLFLYISQTVIEIVRSWILLHITTRVNVQVLSDFLLKLMGLPISFFDSKNTGDFLQRIHDHNRISDFISIKTLVAAIGVFNLVLFGFVLIYFSMKIFFVFLLGTTAYFLWSVSFLKKRARIDIRRFQEESENHSSILELINGIDDIKLNGSQVRRRTEWYRIQSRLFDVSVRSLKLQQIQLKVGNVIHGLMNIVIIYFASVEAVSGEITLGTMLAIMYILGSLSGPVKDLVRFIFDYQDAKLSILRLEEIHGLEEEVGEQRILPNKLYKNLHFSDVAFSYPGTGDKLILNNLNFSIPIGKTTAIVGESGAGKTTILKMLLLIYDPSAGRIFLDNEPLEKINKKYWRSKCGVVIQNGYIFNDTIRNNITESSSNEPFDSEKFWKAIEIANLRNLVDNLANGDNTKIGDSGINLSGGERQRVLIARAVYKDPEFIFFDEATSSLDSKNEKEIMKNLEIFYKGKTVVTIAHRMSTVRNADKVIVLHKGNIVESGTHEELIAKEGKYFDLVKGQL